MKNSKLVKTIWSVVLGLLVVSIGFLGYSYFSKEGKVTEKSSTQQTKKKDESKTDEEKYKNSENTSNTQKDNSKSSSNEVIVGGQSTGEVRTQNVKPNNTATEKDTNALAPAEYNGKRLSRSEGLGTTGKVFKTQKEALEFGNSEIERLVKEDKKPRQFSISKVSSEDGSLVGWTVDIFEGENTSNNNE